MRTSWSKVRDLASRLWREVPADHVFTVSAGLAYYGVFGLLPTLAGAAALWAQVGDIGILQQSAQSGSDSGILPQDAAGVIKQFLAAVPENLTGGFGLALNLLLVLFTAWRAARTLMTALNITYDVEEQRGLIGRFLVALVIGAGGMLFLFAALAVLALPPLLARVPILESWTLWARWPVLALGFGLGLAMLFRYGPRRREASWRHVGCGAASATLLWILASIGVSFYVRHVTDFGQLYGSLGSFAVVLLWFWSGAVSVLIGAEIDDVLSPRSTQRSGDGLKQRLRRRSRPS